MKMGKLNKKMLLVLIVSSIIVITIAYYYVGNIMHDEKIGDFQIVSDLYYNVTEKIYSDLFMILKSPSSTICESGKLWNIEYEGGILYINCSLVKIRINNTLIQNRTLITNLPITAISVNSTGSYTLVSPKNNFTLVYSGKLHLNVELPERVIQGLVKHYYGGDCVEYCIVNIPYFYVKAEYLRGSGKVWHIIKPRLLINNVNISKPSGMGDYKFSSNGGRYEVVLFVPNCLSESDIIDHHDILKAFLDISGGKVVNIVWYIEVYLEDVTEDFDIELTIGYPALIVAKS